MNVFGDLYKKIPEVGIRWRELTFDERKSKVETIIFKLGYADNLRVHSCEDGGYIFLVFIEEMISNIRGDCLLNIEEELKCKLDSGLTVWLCPQGDKSSLRRLRGVKVKTI
jgi:hypothetical protein